MTNFGVIDISTSSAYELSRCSRSQQWPRRLPRQSSDDHGSHFHRQDTDPAPSPAALKRQHLDDAIGAVRKTERELDDNIGLIELGEAEGDKGPQAMQDVASTIQEGASAFIRRQYTTIFVLAVVGAVVIGLAILATPVLWRRSSQLWPLGFGFVLAILPLLAVNGTEVVTGMFSEAAGGYDEGVSGDPIDRIADKKIVHKNMASRTKSRLAQAIKTM
ncbi:MAG: hypothetical protein HC938_09695 [Nitrospira sp.]|nr:hypothetical protein [Nitrospira sp.]